MRVIKHTVGLTRRVTAVPRSVYRFDAITVAKKLRTATETKTRPAPPLCPRLGAKLSRCDASPLIAALPRVSVIAVGRATLSVPVGERRELSRAKPNERPPNKTRRSLTFSVLPRPPPRFRPTRHLRYRRGAP